MCDLVARTGRLRQRYQSGFRLIAGCIPFRYRDGNDSGQKNTLEVLMISSQSGPGLLFPKGGWENDETVEEAAVREAVEEAGVREKWTTTRKLMYILARRFPSFLRYFYNKSFLSGKHGQPEKWLSMSLGKKDKALMEEQYFKEFWERDIEESVRQWDSKAFVKEAVLQVSNWGFSLADVQVQRKREAKGFLPFLKSLYSQVEREWSGFLGPIHIWQGMDDWVTPPSMTEFVRRVVPGATVHRLLGEGHFSYFCFCDECHRHIFSTLFGTPKGPLEITALEEIPLDNQLTEEACHNFTDLE